MKKILWLCTFTDSGKRGALSLWKGCHVEVGQWIPNLLQSFEQKRSEFEIHVVSTESWLKPSVQSWQRNGIHFHCFKSGVPVFGRPWPAKVPVDHISGFVLNRKRIARIVNDVKPDLIHLFGVENPQYGAAVLDLIQEYPVVVTIQGFIHRELDYHNNLLTRIRCDYEQRLLKACHHYMGDYESEKVVREYCFGAEYRYMYFPVNEALVARTPSCDNKLYDMLFVGSLTKEKGFGDYLEIVRMLKDKIKGLKAAVVGRIESYAPAAEYVMRNELEDNIIWLKRFPTQVELFKVFKSSKVFLSPTYNDCFASTIRESMLLGTPVVAYRTGGIPWANRDGKKNISLIKQGDANSMAEAVLKLLRNEEELHEISHRARLFAESEFALEPNVQHICGFYNDLIAMEDK